MTQRRKSQFELKKEDREREYEKHTYKKKHDEVDPVQCVECGWESSDNCKICRKGYVMDKYLEFKQLQLDSLIKQAIDNCFMTHKYEYPGMERGLCAGLRKQNGEGELTEVCKECKFNYIWEEENQN